MSILNTGGSWHVGRASGRCAACGVELVPDVVCWAALCDGLPVKRGGTGEKKNEKGDKKEKAAEAESPFVRIDFCQACWEKGARPEQLSAVKLGLVEPGAGGEPEPKLEMFSFWKTTMPLPQQKKKLLVDDSVLMDVFGRMEDKKEPQEVRFRFVLALILMRKRLLKYEGTEETPAVTDSLAPRAPEVWKMVPKIMDGGSTPGSNWGPAVHVVNPHLTAEQITEVSQQLSAILAEEL